MAKLEFHFDFGSPNAYLAHLVVPQIEQRTGAKFEYVPILLERRRFVRRHGITNFTWNPFFPVNTLLIMRGAVAAQREGVFARYVDAMFRCMWAEPKKMDDPEVVRAALTQTGLDAAALLARTQEAEVKDRLLKNTEASVARGTFGSPTFFVGNEIFFGKDRLRDVEEEIARANA
jgi:2-hydroxychromene-2-carboxylate isomerase